MADNTFRPGDSQNDLLRKILGAVDAGNGGGATELTLGQVLAEETLAVVALSQIASNTGDISANGANDTTLNSVLTALGPLATQATLASVLSALSPLATQTTLAAVQTASDLTNVRLSTPGLDVITGTDANNGSWTAFHALEDCVIAAATITNSAGSLAGITLKAGDRIFGIITSWTLTSGKGILYRA